MLVSGSQTAATAAQITCPPPSCYFLAVRGRFPARFRNVQPQRRKTAVLCNTHTHTHINTWKKRPSLVACCCQSRVLISVTFFSTDPLSIHPNAHSICLDHNLFNHPLPTVADGGRWSDAPLVNAPSTHQKSNRNHLRAPN